MILIVLLNDYLVLIPMAALVGVMVMVCIATFDWSSLKTLHKAPLTDTIVRLQRLLLSL